MEVLPPLMLCEGAGRRRAHTGKRQASPVTSLRRAAIPPSRGNNLNPPEWSQSGSDEPQAQMLKY